MSCHPLTAAAYACNSPAACTCSTWAPAQDSIWRYFGQFLQTHTEFSPYGHFQPLISASSVSTSSSDWYCTTRYKRGVVWSLGVGYSGAVSQSWRTVQFGNLVLIFLDGRGVRWIAFAMAKASVMQMYTSGGGAWRPLTSANVWWSEQCLAYSRWMSKDNAFWRLSTKTTLPTLTHSTGWNKTQRKHLWNEWKNPLRWQMHSSAAFAGHSSCVGRLPCSGNLPPLSKVPLPMGIWTSSTTKFLQVNLETLTVVLGSKFVNKLVGYKMYNKLATLSRFNRLCRICCQCQSYAVICRIFISYRTTSQRTLLCTPCMPK